MFFNSSKPSVNSSKPSLRNTPQFSLDNGGAETPGDGGAKGKETTVAGKDAGVEGEGSAWFCADATGGERGEDMQGQN